MSIVHKIESNLPQKFVDNWRFIKLYLRKQRQYKRVIKRLKKKESPIRVFFFALDPSTWKYESVYRLMEKDDKFDPIVLVCPIDNQGEEYKHNKLEECYKYFSENNYNVISTYDKEHDTYLDAHELKPDIIFYTNPYRYLIDDGYYIDKFDDVLTCYVDYSLEIMNERWAYSQPLQQLVWKYFVPSNQHKNIVESSEHCFVDNARVSGYPTSDLFLKELAKSKKNERKVIVWAPHQSIFVPKTDDEKSVRWSTFLLYADDMMSTIRKNKDIHFIFRPHPLLKTNLYNHLEWGKERTDKYYEELLSLPNVELSVGDYIEQFCKSDALIHDGGGFMAEYIYTQKPCLYLSNYICEYIDKNRFNELGIAAWKAHYHAYGKNDIDNFIEHVVIEGNDSMRKQRAEVLHTYLAPPQSGSVAENITGIIKSEISNIK